MSNKTPEVNPEKPSEPQFETRSLARLNFLVTFNYDSPKDNYIEESKLLHTIELAVEREFADVVSMLFNGQVKVRIERLQKGSVFGTLALVLVSGVSVYQFIAQYQDFHDSLVLLRQHLNSLLNNEVRQVSGNRPNIRPTVLVTAAPTPEVAQSLAVRSEQSVPSEVNQDLLRIMAEDVILNLPIVRFGKWFLSGAIAVGIAVWIGGAIFGAVQIKSVQEQSQATLQEIRQVEQDVVDAELQLRHFLETQTGDVQQASKETITRIEEERAGTILQITKPVTDVQRASQEALNVIGAETSTAVQEIQASKKQAIELLAVDSLPDLRELKRQIAVLDAAKGRLDFDTYAKFVGSSIINILFVAGMAIILSALAVVIAIWPRRSY
jgi:hypothetical protein